MSGKCDNLKVQPARPNKSFRIAIALGIAVIVALGVWWFLLRDDSLTQFEKLASEFYHADERGLRWDYEGLAKAYSDRMREGEVLDLLVKSQAAHLIPQIIDSMQPDVGGYTNRKLDAIAQLTRHDFSTELGTRRVWDKEYTEATRTFLHNWWEQNGEQVLEMRGPKDTFDVPNRWSSLSFELRTEKAEYLPLEPVRVTVILKNISNTWVTFAYRPYQPTFEIDLLRISDNGETNSITKAGFPRTRWDLRDVSALLTSPSHLIIHGGHSCINTRWLEDRYWGPLPFEPGKITIRAELKVLRGRHKGKTIVSNDLTLQVVEPRGIDAEAYKFVTRYESMDLGNDVRSSPAYVRMYLIYSPQGFGWLPVAEYFVGNYEASVYTDYVRYTLATEALNQYGKKPSCDLMVSFIDKTPRDFPLLADAYVSLLEYYRESGQLDRMSALSETIKIDRLKIVDPRLVEKLTELVGYVPQIVRRIHEKGAYGRTLLHSAAGGGPAALVEFLISKGADVNAGREGGVTPLYFAVTAGRKENVEILIRYGADVNVQTRDGNSILFWATASGHKDIIEILLANGADVNLADRNGRIPVHYAIADHRHDVVKLLINARDPNGRTSLHWAVDRGEKALTELLISNGAKIDIADNNGRTPLQIALQNAKSGLAQSYIAELLCEHGIDE